MPMKGLWGFDLDDVLCLTGRWRAPFQQTKKLWIQVPAIHRRLQHLFSAEPELQSFIASLRDDGHRIAVVTARRPWCRAVTAHWLEQNGIAVDHLVFKPAVEPRMTPRYKADIVRELGCDAFVDDDPANVAALRAVEHCMPVLWSPERRDAALAELREVRQKLEARVV